jgi:hypothetical protein
VTARAFRGRYRRRRAGARDIEESAWDSQIQKAFKRVSSKN